MKCESCKTKGIKKDMWSEFNKYLCDDCYTEYRVELQTLFGLKDIYEVDDLLSHINFIKWIRECRT